MYLPKIHLLTKNFVVRTQDGRLAAIFVSENKPILQIFEVFEGSFAEGFIKWFNILVADAPTIDASMQ